jgi:hypothetical protein
VYGRGAFASSERSSIAGVMAAVPTAVRRSVWLRVIGSFITATGGRVMTIRATWRLFARAVRIAVTAGSLETFEAVYSPETRKA